MDVDDDPARMLQLLDSRYASNRTVSRIAVQTQLFRMSCNGQDMSSYIDQYTSLFSQLERMGKDSAIPDSHKAPMLLASIDQACSLESTATALRTKDASELTWNYAATTLIDDYNAKSTTANSSRSRDRCKKGRRGNPGSQPTKNSKASDHLDSESDTDSTIRALAVALKSVKTDTGGHDKKHQCDFCGKSGHKEDRCYQNPANPDNKLAPKLREMFQDKAAAAVVKDKTRAKKTEIAGSLVEKPLYPLLRTIVHMLTAVLLVILFTLGLCLYKAH